MCSRSCAPSSRWKQMPLPGLALMALVTAACSERAPTTASDMPPMAVAAEARRSEPGAVPSVASKGPTRHSGGSGPHRPSVTMQAPSGSSHADLRALIIKLRQKRVTGMPDLTLSEQVLYALEATTEAERHRRVQELPVTVEHDVQGGVVVTTVKVRGVEKLRVTHDASASDASFDRAPSTSPDLAPQEGEMVSDGLLSMPEVREPSGPSERTSISCGSAEDPCATQAEKDEYLAMAVAVQSDMQSTSSAVQSQYSACITAWACLDQEESAEAAVWGGPLETSEAHESGWSSAGGPEATACADHLRGETDCGPAYLGAISGVAWAASAVGALVIATSSPEPVSKGMLGVLWSNVVAGVASAVQGVWSAYSCWAS